MIYETVELQPKLYLRKMLMQTSNKDRLKRTAELLKNIRLTLQRRRICFM